MNTGRCSVERVKSKKKGTHFRHFSLSNKNLSKPNTQKGTEDFVQSKTKLEANRPCWSYLCVCDGGGGGEYSFFFTSMFFLSLFLFFRDSATTFFLRFVKGTAKKIKKGGFPNYIKRPNPPEGDNCGKEGWRLGRECRLASSPKRCFGKWKEEVRQNAEKEI